MPLEVDVDGRRERMRALPLDSGSTEDRGKVLTTRQAVLVPQVACPSRRTCSLAP